MDLFGFLYWSIPTLIGLFTIYRYLISNYGFLEKQGIPTDRPLPFFGNMLERRNMLLHEVDELKYYKLGKIYGVYEGRNPTIVIGNLDLIRILLVKNFIHFTDRRSFGVGIISKHLYKALSSLRGQEWRSTRHALSFPFTSAKLKQIVHLMDDSMNDLIKRLNEKIKVNETKTLELKSEFEEFVSDVISSCAFGATLDAKDNFFHHVRKIFSQDYNLKLFLAATCPWLLRFLKIQVFPQDSFDYLTDLAKNIIKKRRSDITTRNDFLQILLDAKINEDLGIMENVGRENVFESDHYNIESHIKNFPESTYYNRPRNVLTDEVIISQVLLFLLAGFDTLSSTLSFVLHELALNPQIQDKLSKEIKETIANNGTMNHEVIMQMEYTDMVLSETLRLHPPGSRLERVCTSDCHLGGMLIKKGMLVAIPIPAVHRDPLYFPNPLAFDPERFNKDNKPKIKPYTYIPFGAGPRNCIGMRFALMLIKIALVRILDVYTIKRCEETEVPVKLRDSLGLTLPANGITLALQRKK